MFADNVLEIIHTPLRMCICDDVHSALKYIYRPYLYRLSILKMRSRIVATEIDLHTIYFH